MPLTQYARDQFLQYGFTGVSLTRPTAWYLSSHTGCPGDSGTSIANELTSGTATSYARAQLTGGNALALSSHLISNGGLVTVGPAGAPWPAATWWGICDALTGGNQWAYAELSQYGSSFFLAAAQASALGSGHAANDVLTLTGGGGAQLTIDAVASVGGVSGIPTEWHVSNHGSVTSIPANPMATTSSGSGTGFTCLGTWLEAPQSFTLNAGDSITFSAGQLQLAMA